MDRTAEERKLFYEERNGILEALSDIQEPKPLNEEELGTTLVKKTTVDPKETLRGKLHGSSLVPICGHLAGLVMRRATAKMGREVPEREVTLEDIKILKEALHVLLNLAGDETERVRIKQALSRVNPVRLVHAAIYGENFGYKECVAGRNGINSETHRTQYFGGIPEDRLPSKTIPIRKGNMTEVTRVVDLGIYPENMKKIYDILKELEVADPLVKRPGDGGKIVSREINRAGEAEFFLRHLPPGLKKWAEEKKDTGS